MLSFVLLAAGLTVAGVLLVAIPLLRGSATASAPWTALLAAGVLVIGSAVLYVTWSNWSWRAAPAANSPQGMVARLARELESNPDNRSGWLMLGRSYIVLQEYPLAYRAYERADHLSAGRDPEALTGEAEALAMNDRSELDGRAGRLIERALTLDPDSRNALFFGAAVAERRGDLALARARFSKLLTLNPPDAVRPFLEQQIVAIDKELAQRAAGPPGAATAATPASTPASPSAAPPSAAARVRVTITLADSLRTAAGASPLYVFVRDPAHPGPPLAARRLASQFPQTVELTAKDAMIPGRAFAAGQSVQVVARIARSGSPIGASGDPYGEITYQVGRDGLVSMVIDRVTP